MSSKDFTTLKGTEVKKRSFFSKLRRASLFVFLIVILAIAAAGAVGYYYKDDVKGLVINELNKHLNTKIIIDGKNINFTVLKNFPYAAVEFHHVTALEAVKNRTPDTLFQAGVISLQFNLIDIYQKNYSVKKVLLKDVDLFVRVDKNGNDNYHFWKPSTTQDSSDFSFSLERITATNVYVDYKNYQSKQAFEFIVVENELSGSFSADDYSLKTESNIYINNIVDKQTSYLQDKNIRLELNVLAKNDHYRISNSLLGIEELLLNVDGNVVMADNVADLDLRIDGDNIDIENLLSLVPSRYKEKIENYDSKGSFEFTSLISGKMSARETPQVKMAFEIKEAQIVESSSGVPLSNVLLKGTFTNGDRRDFSSSVLQVDSFSANINEGKIVLAGAVSQFDNPLLKGIVKADFSLGQLNGFLKFDKVEEIAGDILLEASLDGTFDDLFSKISTEGNIEGDLFIKNGSLKLQESTIVMKDINGDFDFHKNKLLINELTGYLDESDFLLKGSLLNLAGFFVENNEDVIVDASLESQKLDLNTLLASNEKTYGVDDYKFSLPEYLDLRLDATIQELSFRKFNATTIDGVVKVRNQKMLVDQLQFSALDGAINLTGTVDCIDTTKVMVNCFSELKNINIKKLFFAFENFGQMNITDANIEGALTADVRFAASFSPELELDDNSVSANIDMKVEKGELNKVESMKSLSRFVELEELENVTFSTLTNQFEINKKTISFPKMKINSNAFSVTVAGRHTFDNEINYRIGLTLDKLLFRKAKKAKRENETFGKVEDDGLGRTSLFIIMKGTVDNPIFKYDKKEAVLTLKNNIKTEKATLKEILREEFKSKKDTTVRKKKPEPAPDFIIDWEEEKEEEPQPSKTLKRPRKEDFSNDEDY